MKSAKLSLLFAITAMLLIGNGVAQEDLSRVILNEPFDNNNRRWPLFANNAEARAEIKGGSFLLGSRANEWYFCTTPLSLNQQDDFEIQCTVKKLRGVDDHFFGLIWGLKDYGNFYNLTLTGDGRIAVTKKENDGFFNFNDPSTPNPVVSRQNAVNKLRIKKEGNRLKFFVNDHAVHEMPFQSFFGPYIGFLVYNEIQLAFDDLVVTTKPPTPFYLTDAYKGPGFTTDFEDGTVRGWTVAGPGFSSQPRQENPSSSDSSAPSSQHQGKYLVASSGSFGTMTSAEFIIPRPYISFLIGGGDSPYSKIGLSVNNTEIRAAHGKRTATMRRVYWDVYNFVGRRAKIMITAYAMGAGGNIKFDDLQFHAQLPPDFASSEIEGERSAITSGEISRRQDLSHHFPRSNNYGYAVAMDGNVAVIGAFDDVDAQAVKTGSVLVASARSSAKLFPSDPTKSKAFGLSVAFSGNTIIVGAPNDAPSGAAYIFQRSGESCVQQAKLQPSDGKKDNIYFGGAVAVHGDFAVVGAMRHNHPVAEAGKAYIFRNVAGKWIEHTTLANKTPQPNEHFGNAVAITNDYIFVGAVSASGKVSPTLNQPTVDAWGRIIVDTDNGEYAGAVYCYRRSGDTWVEHQRLTTPDEAGMNYFGSALAVNQDRLIVGAPGNAFCLPNQTGKAFVFLRRGEQWKLETELTWEGDEKDDLGRKVAISGNYALVSAPGKNAVYAFRSENILGHANEQKFNWHLFYKIILDEEEKNKSYKSSLANKDVAISGTQAFIGPYAFDLGNLKSDSLIAENRLKLSWRNLTLESKLDSVDRLNVYRQQLESTGIKPGSPEMKAAEAKREEFATSVKILGEELRALPGRAAVAYAETLAAGIQKLAQEYEKMGVLKYMSPEDQTKMKRLARGEKPLDQPKPAVAAASIELGLETLAFISNLSELTEHTRYLEQLYKAWPEEFKQKLSRAIARDDLSLRMAASDSDIVAMIDWRRKKEEQRKWQNFLAVGEAIGGGFTDLMAAGDYEAKANRAGSFDPYYQEYNNDDPETYREQAQEARERAASRAAEVPNRTAGISAEIAAAEKALYTKLRARYVNGEKIIAALNSYWKGGGTPAYQNFAHWKQTKMKGRMPVSARRLSIIDKDSVEVSGNVRPSLWQEFYVFRLAKPAALAASLQITSGQPRHPLHVQLFDKRAGKYIMKETLASKALAIGPGEYLIRVAEYSMSSTASYDLQLLFKPVTEATTPLDAESEQPKVSINVKLNTSEKSVTPKNASDQPNLQGVWRGEVKQPGFGTYPIVMTIFNLAVGSNSGKINYPTLQCGGALTCISIKGSEYTLRENIEFGRNCIDRGTIQIKAKDDERLSWMWFYPNGKKGASGTLHLESRK